MPDNEEIYANACAHALETGQIKAVMYRRGAVVTGWPSRWPDFGSLPRKKRGVIGSQTTRSLIRASFAIANSPADFDLLSTLTFRVPHPDPKAVLRRWCVGAGLATPSREPWAWVMEFQERGVVHFHVLSTLEAMLKRYGPTSCKFVERHRGGQPRRILTGLAGEEVANLWIRLVGDESNEFRRFQLGGITELVDKPEEAGKYLGSYIGKMAQKTLPKDHPNMGRWWWISKGAMPVEESAETVRRWPFKRAHHFVYDKARISTSSDRSGGAI